jgi:cyclopropane-fatty-acyl-phospholipid synthase
MLCEAFPCDNLNLREKNFRHACPDLQIATENVSGEMWRFYLFSCAGAFRARSLNIFSILFSKEGTSTDIWE